jgi:hypothetical protein
VIESDSIHEGSGPDRNPILTLGLVRCVLQTILDMSEELGRDTERHAKWREILEGLSDFPTHERNGRRIFRLSEEGMAWSDSNTLAIQHIYPSGAIGPDSRPELKEIARDTIDEMDRWFDTNGMNSLYPAAVRVGYDAEFLLSKLDEHCRSNLNPNGYTFGNPHGIETCSTVPNTINEMLMMSHGGIIRVFHNWPRRRNAAFAGLRAHGAFLVSSALKDGEVTGVEILSEKGRRCTIANPWPQEAIEVTRSGGEREELRGAAVTMSTKPGESLALRRSRT